MAKRFVIILFCIGATLSLRAEFIFNAGYQCGVFHLGNINRTMRTYNYARPWLTQSMPYFGFLQGYQMNMCFIHENWGIEIGMNSMTETNEAYGKEPDTGLEAHRKIKVGAAVWNFGFTRILKHKSKTEMGWTLTLDRIHFHGTTYYTNGQESDEMLCILQKSWSNTLRFNFSWYPTKKIGFSLRPYVLIPWRKVYMEGFMIYLQGDTENPQRSSTWHYGVTLDLSFRFGHKDY